METVPLIESDCASKGLRRLQWDPTDSFTKLLRECTIEQPLGQIAALKLRLDGHASVMSRIV